MLDIDDIDFLVDAGFLLGLFIACIVVWAGLEIRWKKERKRLKQKNRELEQKIEAFEREKLAAMEAEKEEEKG